MPDRGGIQLLPNTKHKINVRTPGENRFLMIGLFSFGLMLAVYVGMLQWKNSVDADRVVAESQIQDLEKERNKDQEQYLLEIEQQTQLIDRLLGDHILWTAAINRLGEILHPEVVLTSFSGDSSGHITMNVIAPSFTVVAEQIAAFQKNDGVQKATISPLTVNKDGFVEFDAELDVIAAKFFKAQ